MLSPLVGTTPLAQDTIPNSLRSTIVPIFADCSQNCMIGASRPPRSRPESRRAGSTSRRAEGLLNCLHLLCHHRRPGWVSPSGGLHRREKSDVSTLSRELSDPWPGTRRGTTPGTGTIAGTTCQVGSHDLGGELPGGAG